MTNIARTNLSGTRLDPDWFVIPKGCMAQYAGFDTITIQAGENPEARMKFSLGRCMTSDTWRTETQKEVNEWAARVAEYQR